MVLRSGNQRFLNFLEEGGRREMFLEICRFLGKQKASWILKTGKYSIAKVMGPDEFS